MELSRLTGADYDRGFLETLSALKPINLTRDGFGNVLRDRLRRRIETVVAIEKGKVVATGAIFIEPKFYGNVGHIEDVVTDPAYRGNGYGAAVVNECINIARQHSCYKVILDCADKNVDWYSKLGFYKFENQMRINL